MIFANTFEEYVTYEIGFITGICYVFGLEIAFIEASNKYNTKGFASFVSSNYINAHALHIVLLKKTTGHWCVISHRDKSDEIFSENRVHRKDRIKRLGDERMYD